MFDIDSCQYKENVEAGIKDFKKAVSYGRELMDRYMGGVNVVFVLLASEDWEVNYYTLHFLKAYQIQNKIQKFIILSSDKTMRKFVEETCKVPYEFLLCDERDLISLERLYNIFRLENFFIVNSFKYSADKDCFRLVDGKSVTKADIVAELILQLSHVPTEEELGGGDAQPFNGALQPRQHGGMQRQWCKMYKMIPHISENAIELETIVEHALAPLIKDKKIGLGHRIALFGVTKTAQCAVKILENYDIKAYLDNDIKKVGQTIAGIPVRLPEDLPREDNPYLVILICTRRYREALAQLMELGYEPNKSIFIVYSVSLGNDLSEESEEYLLETKILEGKKVYEEIRRKYPEETMIIRPYAGTGDIYLLGGYIPHLEKKFHMKKVILIVPGVSETKVAKMFGIEALSYTREDIWRLLTFVRMVGFEILNAFSFNINLDQARVRKFNIYRKKDLHTISQKMVFEKKSKVVSFPMHQCSADSLFEKYNLKRGKTVLMSPYATGVKSFSLNEWGKLATAFKKRGFSVCTNIAGKKEHGIEGTKEIFIPYDKVLDFVNKAGIFIAMRSGLCDIVSSTTADMIVFYPANMYQGVGFYYNFFSLEHMGLRKEHLLEMEYVDGLTEQQVCQILGFLMRKN